MPTSAWEPSGVDENYSQQSEFKGSRHLRSFFLVFLRLKIGPHNSYPRIRIEKRLPVNTDYIVPIVYYL